MRMAIRTRKPAAVPPSPRNIASPRFRPSQLTWPRKAPTPNWSKRRRAMGSSGYAPAGRLRIGAALLLGCALTACGSSTREPEATGGPLVMRRLTESQYRATIADIFAPDAPIAARFERGLRQEGLVAI